MMMIGELLCLGAYFFMKYVVHREDPGGYDNSSKAVSPLIMLPVTQRMIKNIHIFGPILQACLFDMVAMSLCVTGLGFLKDAGLYQMLRVSRMVFCGLLSIIFLKKVSFEKLIYSCLTETQTALDEIQV